MWRQVLTLTRLPRFLFQSWQRHARAEELGFRDFSSLFLVKENRRQLGNSACCMYEDANGNRGEMMARTVRFHEYGDASVLKIENLDVAPPGADEVQIDVKSI